MSIDDYTEWDFLTAKPKWLEKARLDMIDEITKNYTNDNEWWFRWAKRLREEANQNKTIKIPTSVTKKKA